MGGSTKTATSTSETEPWSEQIPFLKYGMDEAARLYQQEGPQFYPGSTVAPFSAEQNQAFGLGTDRALSGNATMGAAEGFAQDTLSGKYLNSNPYDDAVFQNIQSKVMPAVNSQFMNSGRTGSNLHGDTMTRALTESYAPYASQQYNMGLDRMGQAASMAPVFAANDYQDLAALEAIGMQKQGLGQRELDDAVKRYSYYQDLPYNKLGQFLNNIGGNYGGTVTSQTPYYQPSMFGQIAGAGMGLLGTAGQLGMFSDARVKENINRVGSLNDGTPVYSYRYKWGGPEQIGVMAQDVEGRYPHVVSRTAEGVRMVDYGALSEAVRA